MLVRRAGLLKDAGKPSTRRDVGREALRDRGGGRVRQPRDPGPRRLRIRRRPPGRALPARRAGDDPLRGHLADPEADHRTRRDRHQRDDPVAPAERGRAGRDVASTDSVALCRLEPPGGAQRPLARADGGARRRRSPSWTPTRTSAASSSPAPTRPSPRAPISARLPSASSTRRSSTPRRGSGGAWRVPDAAHRRGVGLGARRRLRAGAAAAT